MDDTNSYEVTKIEDVSFGSRIIQSFKNITIGLVAILGGIGLLWWNEGNAVEEYKSITEVGNQVVSLSLDEAYKSENGTLFHTQGQLKTKTGIKDKTWKLNVQELALKIDVEMFQVKEEKETKTKDKIGGGQRKETTYKYVDVWSNKEIDSSSFQDEKYRKTNPKMIYKSSESIAKDITLGQFNFPDSFLPNNGYIDYEIDQDNVDNFPDIFSADDYMDYFVDGYLYSGDPSDPYVGDYRVSIKYLPNETGISLIATKNGDSVANYTTANGRKQFLVNTGNFNAEEMISDKKTANNLINWLLRGVGILVIYGGFMSLLSIIPAFASFIPFLGVMAKGITSILSGFLALIIGSLVIGLSWIAHRPILGGLLLLIIVPATTFGIYFYNKKSKTKNLASVDKDSSSSTPKE